MTDAINSKSARKWPRLIKHVDRRPMGYYFLKCSTVGCSNTTDINDTTSHGMPIHMIRQKAQQRGWEVGHKDTEDFCSQCVEEATALRRSKRKLKIVPKEEIPMQRTSTNPEDVRVMTRDDRKVVHTKIQELYVDEAVGYLPGWNDQKVAVDLGVPEAWVAEVRDLLFGPQRDISQDISSLREQAGMERVRVESILLEIDAILPDIQALAKRLTHLSTEAKSAKERIATLESRLLSLVGA